MGLWLASTQQVLALRFSKPRLRIGSWQSLGLGFRHVDAHPSGFLLTGIVPKGDRIDRVKLLTRLLEVAKPRGIGP
jgi:hypothetical protein